MGHELILKKHPKSDSQAAHDGRADDVVSRQHLRELLRGDGETIRKSGKEKVWVLYGKIHHKWGKPWLIMVNNGESMDNIWIIYGDISGYPLVN